MVSNRGWSRSPNAKSPWQQLTSRANESVSQAIATVLERTTSTPSQSNHKQHTHQKLCWLPITPRSNSQCPYHHQQQQIRPPRFKRLPPNRQRQQHNSSRFSSSFSPSSKIKNQDRFKSPLEVIAQISWQLSQPFSPVRPVSGLELSQQTTASYSTSRGRENAHQEDRNVEEFGDSCELSKE